MVLKLNFMQMNFKNLVSDIKSFADDDADVIVENNGDILYSRNGEDYYINVREDLNTGQLIINLDGKTMGYRQFLSKELARLDIFAAKIIEKRGIIEPYIDAQGKIFSNSKTGNTNKSLKLLQSEADDFLLFGTKLTFITADAGHGKTALLKEYQREQAQRYLKGESNYIFWHVDLQGRELVRLNEAIMYDLGELRLSGIYYSSILTLIKRKFIILAIDGFDELAAEIGGSVALGALSSLVYQMDNNGTIFAASRRTFFDTQDYVKRTKILQGKISSECEFHEIKLQNWSPIEAKELISYSYDNADEFYNSLLRELKEEQHPILTRPFLLTKAVEAMSMLEITPEKFIGNSSNSLEGISAIVNAFTEREVNKWKLTDNDTGEPYLSFEQHLQLLSDISQEMWGIKSEKISIEEIELITTLLCEEWRVNAKIKPRIINMVKSHALLIPVSDSQPHLRKFEHIEFKHYFLSNYLLQAIIDLSNSKNTSKYSAFKKFLYVAQLPDSVAYYTFDKLNKSSINVPNILTAFKQIILEEWKPTYLQSNIGTLIPYLLNNYTPTKTLLFDGKVNYLSIIFESKHINNICISNGNFINISFRNTHFRNVIFNKCTFNDIKFHIDSKNSFKELVFKDCTINSVLFIKEGNIVDSAYAPNRIEKYIISQNITIKKEEKEEEVINYEQDTYFKKVLSRFLNRYNNITIQYEKNIEEDGFYSKDRSLILEEVIPMLSEYNIIEKRETKTTKKSNSVAWVICYPLEEIFSADNNQENEFEENLINFWEAVNEK